MDWVLIGYFWGLCILGENLNLNKFQDQIKTTGYCFPNYTAEVTSIPFVQFQMPNYWKKAEIDIS